MKLPKNASRIILYAAVFVFFIPNSFAQTKKIKRPKSTVGIRSVNVFVGDNSTSDGKAQNRCVEFIKI
tara:strand:+ start:3131 stop:3334 length:204 start_codon:yes stop_codon:yes gene_type:complete